MLTDETPARLLARVERLEALAAARDLLDEYAAAADMREIGPVLALFASDATLHSPRGTYVGHEAIARSYADGWALEPSLKRHYVTNARLARTPEGTVHATAYFFYFGRADDRSVIGWGSYDNVIDVSGPRALFRRMTIDHMLSTDLVAGWPLGAPA